MTLTVGKRTASHWRLGATALACAHPVMVGLLQRHGVPRWAPGAPPAGRFKALAESIAYQQLAGRAAAVIWGRVEAVVGRDFSPQAVRRVGAERLRRCGLSHAKVAALLDLAARTADGTVRFDRIGRWRDQQVIDHLTVIRGIGPWTAQMFLLFELQRLDVWPTGDYGVRVGFSRAFGLETLPSVRELGELGAPFAPYRSVLTWWCWRETDTPPKS